MRRGAVVALVLVCACGAVNILLYMLTGSPTQVHPLVRPAHNRVPDAINRVKGKEKTGNVSTSGDVRNIHRNNDASMDRMFTFLINNDTVCSQQDSWTMVIVVISDVRNVNRRQTIRNTWASVAQEHSVLVMFLLGNNSAGVDQSQVIKEAELYNDVIQVDIRESYDNLTYKSIAMLQWLGDYCTNSQTYMKTDDDSFINIANAVMLTRSVDARRWFLCFVFKDAPPDRNVNSKWYTSPEEFKARHFPTYCSGVAYILSSYILSDLYYSSLTAQFLRMEDVFLTGIAAEHLIVRHIHNWKFSFTKRKPTGCAFSDAVSGHEVTIRQMEVIFSQLMSREIDCKTKENLAVKNAEEIL